MIEETEESTAEEFTVEETTTEEITEEESTAVRRGTRLLCPECGSLVSALRDNTEKDLKIIRLLCGHTRGSSLPAKGISLEQIGKEDGLRLFPPDLKLGYGQFRNTLK